MPGSKKARTPADDTRSSAGSSAVDRLDLADALAIGTPDLEPKPITYKGIELDLCRYYTADAVESLVDSANSLRKLSVSIGELERDDPERTAMLQDGVSAALDAIVAQLFPGQEEQTAVLIVKLDERSAGEVARIFQKIYQEAGILNELGEFLAL